MGKPIIWSGTNAKLINSGDLIDSKDNSLTNGGKANYTWTSHGLTVGGATDLGRPVYLVSATALAFADQTLSANAEVVGFIYAVLDANTVRIIFSGEIPTVGSSFLEGGGSLVPGSVYFLSATAGKVTATEPTTIGYVSKPLGVAVSTTEFSAFNMRGSVVGSANARTQITLANNATTTVQDVSLYDAGSLEGWVYIDATTDVRFYVKAPFSKYGAAANYYISPSYVGDTPPAGFAMTVTAGGDIQVTLPSVTGYASAVINFALNAPAVGTNFPLSLNLAQLVPDGTAFSTNGWNSGAVNVTMSASSPTVQRITSPASAVTVTLPTTGIKAGYQMKLVGSACTEANYARLNSSSGAEIDRITGAGFIEVFALIDSPTLSTDWLITNYRNAGSLSFSDVSFSALGGGTWTVDAGDFSVFTYIQTPGLISLTYQCGAFSIAGTVTDLVTTLPSRFKTFINNQTNCIAYNATGISLENGLVATSSGTRVINVARNAGVSWSVTTNASYFRMAVSLLTS